MVGPGDIYGGDYTIYRNCIATTNNNQIIKDQIKDNSLDYKSSTVMELNGICGAESKSREESKLMSSIHDPTSDHSFATVRILDEQNNNKVFNS
jgi:hypothetical protein